MHVFKKDKTMDGKNEIWCGIDISKDDMAVALDVDRDSPVRKLPCRKFPRTPDGVRDLLTWCGSLDARTPRVLMESTGTYSRDVLLWFVNLSPDVSVTVANPRHVKHFIDSEHLGHMV